MSKRVKIIIAISVVLIIAAVCGYFFWYKPNYIDKKPGTPSPGTDVIGKPAATPSLAAGLGMSNL